MKQAIYIILISVVSLFAGLHSLFAATPEAEFIKIEREYTLRNDGSTEARYRKELKLFTHLAMNSLYGETFIIYNPLYQELKFHSSYTRQADGTIIQTPPNAFNEVLPAAAANAPAYNHLKEMVVTHTGLELGATIYLDYSIISKPGYLPALDVAESLQELSPVKEYTIAVNVPEGTTANYSLTGVPGTVNTRSKNGFTVYTWKLKNMPASAREPFMPQAIEYIPYFTFNTYSSAQEMLNTINYKRDFSDIHIPPANKEMLTTDEKTDHIHQYVTKQMDYCRLSLVENGRTLRIPREVIQSAYGTAAEKALLLNLMLYKEGIASDIVLLYPKGLEVSIPGFSPIKEIGVITTYKGQKVFLSVQKNQVFTLPELACNYDIWAMSGSNFGKLPIDRAGEQAVSTFSQEVSIGSDSLRWEKSSILSGLIPGIYYKSGYTNSKDEAGKTTFKLNETKSTAIPWNESGYFKYAPGGYSTGVNGFNMYRMASERKTPFAIPFKTEDTVIHTLLLAPGIECKTPPASLNITNKAGALNIKLTNENGKVTIAKHIKLNKEVYSSVEYNDLRKLMLEWYNPNINTVILYNQSVKR